MPHHHHSLPGVARVAVVFVCKTARFQSISSDMLRFVVLAWVSATDAKQRVMMTTMTHPTVALGKHHDIGLRNVCVNVSMNILSSGKLVAPLYITQGKEEALGHAWRRLMLACWYDTYFTVDRIKRWPPFKCVRNSRGSAVALE